MNKKAFKEIERKLHESEKRTSLLEQKLKISKETLRVEKQKTKSLSSKLARRDSSHSATKAELSTLKKTLFPGIDLQSIDRHKYPEFVISMALNIYTITNCGLRKSVELLSFLNETLGWNLSDIPCRNSVENWAKKSGLNIYNNSRLKTRESEYGMIIDESIMLGNERMILTLGTGAKKTSPKPLDYGDIEVIGIHVDPNWNSAKIVETLREDEEKMGRKPDYIVSDNESKFRKAIADYGCVHIRDVGHTLAMFLQRVYDKETDFIAFFKKIGRVKVKEVMNDCTYLLPPRQRTLARFMNLSRTASWASKVIDSFSRFTKREKGVYRFVVQNQKLVRELQSVFECVDRILSEIKTSGLSYHSIGGAMVLLESKLNGKQNKRIRKFVALTMEYLRQEAVKLQSSAVAYNASSDVIESIFGYYKYRMSQNALHGVTTYALILPLITKMKEPNKGLDTNFKSNLKNVYMRDLHQWKKAHLTENQTIKRRERLTA